MGPIHVGNRKKYVILSRQIKYVLIFYFKKMSDRKLTTQLKGTFVKIKTEKIQHLH